MRLTTVLFSALSLWIILFGTVIANDFALTPQVGWTGPESFIPPVPDKSKTLPANDGKSDGCDSSRFKCVMGGEAVLDKKAGGSQPEMN